MIVYTLHSDRANKKTFVMCRGNDLEKIDNFDTGKKRWEAGHLPVSSGLMVMAAIWKNTKIRILAILVISVLIKRNNR